MKMQGEDGHERKGERIYQECLNFIESLPNFQMLNIWHVFCIIHNESICGSGKNDYICNVFYLHQ